MPLIVLLIAALPSCTRQRAARRAQEALHYAIELDKQYIDTTDTGILTPAVEYYRRYGTPEEQMRTWYYLGRIQKNRGDVNDAFVSYSLAEEAASQTEDLAFRGMIAMGFADIYARMNNLEEEKASVDLGMHFFETAGDSAHYHLALGRAAPAYQNLELWGEADSLYRTGIALSGTDSIAIPIFLSNYAAMKMLQPEPDPAGAIALLGRKIGEYGSPLSIKDYGVYAYASAMAGDDATCEALLAQFASLDEKDRIQSLYWEYRTAAFRGDYEMALDALQRTYVAQDAAVEEILSGVAVSSLQDYYQEQALEARHRVRTQRLTAAALLLAVLLLSGGLIGLIIRRRNRERAEAEELLRITEESARMLQQANTTQEEKLDALRRSFASMYKAQFSSIDTLCRTWLLTQDRVDQKDIIYRNVAKLVTEINNDQLFMETFEAQIDRDLDNIVTHLKEDLAPLSGTDERFLCYCIVGFDADTIGLLLRLSQANVYTKRSRLRERIRRLDSPHKELYLQMI